MFRHIICIKCGDKLKRKKDKWIGQRRHHRVAMFGLEKTWVSGPSEKCHRSGDHEPPLYDQRRKL